MTIVRFRATRCVVESVQIKLSEIYLYSFFHNLLFSRGNIYRVRCVRVIRVVMKINVVGVVINLNVAGVVMKINVAEVVMKINVEVAEVVMKINVLPLHQIMFLDAF